MRMNRGKLTTAIQDKSQELLGYAITEQELVLMAYVQQVMLDSQALNIANIRPGEREILRQWREKGFIEGGASGMGMTKEFWDAIHELLWMGFVYPEQ